MAKQFYDFLDGVSEEHINCQKKGSEDHVVSPVNEEEKDFVEVLLWVQKGKRDWFPY